VTDSGLWPTPNAADALGGPGNQGRQGGLNLRTAVAWATPQARDYRTGEAHRWDDPSRSRNLNDQAAIWPTPKSRDHKSGKGKASAQRDSPGLEVVVYLSDGGKLNPVWVEWLMGWPLGWTDLKPLAMDRFRLWQQQHGIC